MKNGQRTTDSQKQPLAGFSLSAIGFFLELPVGNLGALAVLG
jgi:hypothetical protein